MSSGDEIDNPKHLKRSEDRLKALQSHNSKRRTGEAGDKLVRLHGKEANQRRDFLHKLSRKIVHQHGYIFKAEWAARKLVKARPEARCNNAPGAAK